MNFPIPKQYSGQLIESVFVSPRVKKFTIKLEQEFVFYPGQFISLKVSDNTYRSYSICSSPKNKNEISLLIAVGHSGVGANYLRELQVGAKVSFIGPSGRFILPSRLANNLLFIATGTGIAPILAMLETLREEEAKNEINLLFGVRDESECFEIDTLDVLKKRLHNFNYSICYSQRPPENLSNALMGRVTSHIKIDKVAQYFICGNPNMVIEVAENLLQNGISEENIFHEKFTVAQK